MSLQQFSQALLTEHFLVVSCQAFTPPENLIQLIRSLENPGRKLCIALPYSTLMRNHAELTSLNVWKGLSDIPSLDPLTFTAQITLRLAKEANIDFAVIGGNTARHVLYESDHSIAAKLRGLLDAKITPVVCFGETLQDYVRGATADVIKEQLSVLLLGLTFDQIIKTVLVYKAPWLNNIAPELFSQEYNKAHHIVFDLLQHLFGQDAASHISLLTDLPWISEDFSKIESDLPPSGYFLELEGKGPRLISGYFNILNVTSFKAPPSPMPILAPSKTTTPEKAEKIKKPRKKKGESVVEVSVVEVSEIEDLTEHEEKIAEESVHDTILSVEHELESPTIHFDLNEPTGIALEEDQSVAKETTTDEDFELEWYSDEELEALRKEFGIQSDGTIIPKPVPVWDNSRPVRIIKTQAQKAVEAAKPAKPAKPKKKPQKS